MGRRKEKFGWPMDGFATENRFIASLSKAEGKIDYTLLLKA
jgi:hypothetical protein